jgi:hypothetical protein
MNTVMDIGFHKKRELLDQMGDYQLVKDSAPFR